MRKVAFHLVAILLLFVAGQTFAAEKLPKGFSTFRTSLKKSVLKGDRSAIATIMAPDFQWAMDPEKVSPVEALKLMDQFGLWQNFKQASLPREG